MVNLGITNKMDSLVKELSDKECLVQLLLDLNTPIGQRKLSEEAKYCLGRVMSGGLIQKILNSND